MNITTQEFTSWKKKAITTDFIHLKNITFAEYNIFYHIKNPDSIKSVSDLTVDNTLSFLWFKNRIQQMNLILIDSIFPTILADVVLNVFSNNISSLNEYIKTEKEIILYDPSKDEEYFKYKFFTFIHHLLYSDIATKKVSKGIIDTSKVYYLINSKKEIEYYSIYEQNELQLFLLNKIKLEINIENSFIKEKDANLCLRIFV